ncbi:carbohydrate binding domain-containing protein [Erysipelothrix urinaevulpis]|uniref:carbohydrate binding domain-containing protein n=1 Tax=Erysipelothrix urinaevulpis TaxID=2683717 RepID=UPI00135C8593|nr:carbohydrate binding domain-containing protein [Erysipelothrix urinaevulpis]
MKKMICLVLVCMLLSTGITIKAEETNLLRNPSFEDGLLGWTKEPVKPLEGTNVEIQTDIVSDGNKGIVINDQSSKASIGLKSDRFAIASDTQYKVSGKALAHQNPSRVYIYFFDSEGKTLDATTSFAINPSLETIRELTLFSQEITSPENAHEAQIMLYIGAGHTGTAYYDELSFVEKVESDQVPDVKYHKPRYINDPVQTSLAQGSAFTNRKGDVYQFFGLSGLPVRFTALNHTKNTIEADIEIKNENTIWGITVAPNGHVYFSGTETGNLYEYNIETKSIKTLTQLSDNHRHVWDIKADENGLYLGTYMKDKPGGIIYYDFETEKSSVFATAPEGVSYVRGLGLSERFVYAGIGGTVGQIMRVDKKTGEKEIIDIVIDSVKTPSMFSEITIVDGKILASSGILFVILDEETLEVEGYSRFDGKVSGINPIDGVHHYFKTEVGTIRSYNIETKKFQDMKELGLLPTRNFRTAQWIKNEKNEDVVAFMTTNLEVFFFNPKTNELEEKQSNLPSNGVIIQSMESGNDGNIYIGGYMSGMSIFDPVLEEIKTSIPTFHQPEGIGFVDDEVYFGTYGGAVIYNYSSKNDLNYQEFKEGNPGKIFTIGDQQDRPFVMHEHDGLLYIGTFPTYGVTGGALTIYNPKTKEKIVKRNIVDQQSITGIDVDENYIYLSTSNSGGLGVDPNIKLPSARVAILDKHSLEVIKEVTPNLPNDSNPDFIGSISKGPDGKLWAATVKDALIFSMDSKTLEVEKTIKTSPGTQHTPGFRPYYIKWGIDNKLYTSAGKQLSVIDIEKQTVKKLVSGIVTNFAIDDIGNIFYNIGSEMYKLTIIHNELNMDITDKKIKLGEVMKVDYRLSNHYMDNELINNNLITIKSSDELIMNSNLEALAVGRVKIQACFEDLCSDEITIEVSDTKEEKEPEVNPTEDNSEQEDKPEQDKGIAESDKELPKTGMNYSLYPIFLVITGSLLLAINSVRKERH